MDQKSAITIGIPRAMLYYRYGVLWKAFFEELQVPVVISPPTTRELLESGSSIAVDESCLSAKIFMGHVNALLGKCDAVFIPRYSSLDHNAVFCTRFEGLFDQTRNVFRITPQRFISCNIDEKEKSSEETAFVSLGRELGFSARESKNAYARAWKTDQRQQKLWAKEQEALAAKPGRKILLVGHSYILSGEYATIRDILNAAKDALGIKRAVSFLPICLAKLIAPLYEKRSLRKMQPLFFTPYSIAVLDSNGRFDRSAATAALGYAPRSLQSSIRDMVIWLKETGRS